jgi:hypothetical protein
VSIQILSTILGLTTSVGRVSFSVRSRRGSRKGLCKGVIEGTRPHVHWRPQELAFTSAHTLCDQSCTKDSVTPRSVLSTSSSGEAINRGLQVLLPKSVRPNRQIDSQAWLRSSQHEISTTRLIHRQCCGRCRRGHAAQAGSDSYPVPGAHTQSR